jgi:hypothetical protein
MNDCPCSNFQNTIDPNLDYARDACLFVPCEAPTHNVNPQWPPSQDDGVRVQRQPTGLDRQGSRVPSRPAKRPQLTGARQRLGFTHRETRTFPVPWQGGPARVPPRAPKAPPRNGRARRHQKAHDKMEQSVTEGGCLAVTHARAAGRQPAFQVTSVAIPPHVLPPNS